MICDSLSRCQRYYSVHDRFEAAFDFIRKAVSESLAVGKYELDGKNLYASVQEYDSKAPDMAKNEGHRNYIDIQFVLSGVEVMEVEALEKATLKSEYNPEKDVEFYENGTDVSRLVLAAGEFAIVFPEDIHRPGMQYAGSVPVKKIVVKVRV